MFGRPKPLAVFMVAKCPACGSTALVRTWSVVESRYDGQREESVTVGTHYVCDECNAHLRGTATGPVRVGVPVKPPTAAPPAQGVPPEQKAAIPIRLPRG